MGANNSTLLQIDIEDAPVKPGETVNATVTLTTIVPLKDVPLRVEVNVTAVDENNFTWYTADTMAMNMEKGQVCYRLKNNIPVKLNKPAEQGPKMGTMRILIVATLKKRGGWRSLWRHNMVQLEKEVPVQLR